MNMTATKRFFIVLFIGQAFGFGLTPKCQAHQGPLPASSALCRYCIQTCAPFRENHQQSRAPKRCHDCSGQVCYAPDSRYAKDHGLAPSVVTKPSILKASTTLGSAGTPTVATTNAGS